MQTKWLLRLGSLVLLAGLMGVAGCGKLLPPVRGNGNLVTEAREVGEFSRVEVSGGLSIEVTVKGQTNVEVTIDDNLLEYLVTEVRGDTLKIHAKRNISPSEGTVVKVATPRLTGIEGSGATRTTVAGVKGSKLELDLSGSSQCTLSGEVAEFNVDCSGSSRVDAFDLRADAAYIDASGSSRVDVYARLELNVDVSGASAVRYAGSPAKIKEDASGSSSIRPR